MKTFHQTNDQQLLPRKPCFFAVTLKITFQTVAKVSKICKVDVFIFLALASFTARTRKYADKISLLWGNTALSN